ncbi:hypothetical protein KUBF_00430 [Bacteroides finegoldii]|nr:hypothetical protein KUBF_00430 [Bacteroides finegoldii]
MAEFRDVLPFRYYNGYYGKELNEEFYKNVRRYYPQCPSTKAGLKEYIDFTEQD